MPKVCPENKWWGKNFVMSIKKWLTSNISVELYSVFCIWCMQVSFYQDDFSEFPDFFRFSWFFPGFCLGFFRFLGFYSISQQFITQQKWSECWDCKMVACVCGSAVSVSLLFRKFSLLSLRGPSLGVRELFFSSTEIQIAPEDFS